MNCQQRQQLQSTPSYFAGHNTGIYLQKHEHQVNLLSNRTMVNDKKQQKYNKLIMNGYQTGDTNKMFSTHVVEINSDTTTKSQQQRRELLNVQNTQIGFNENSQGISDDYTRSRRSKTNSSSIEKEPQTSSYSTQGSGYTEEVGNSKTFSNWRNISPTGLCDFRLLNLSTHKQHYSQMSVIEKIRSWKCEEETSDVEDVGTFEKDYESFEAEKKQHMRELRENSNVALYVPPKFIGKEEFKNYDFNEFQQKILQQLQCKTNKYRKLNRGDFILSASKTKRKRSTAPAAATASAPADVSVSNDNSAAKKDYSVQNGDENDQDKITKSRKLPKTTSGINAASRENIEETRETSIDSNGQSMSRVNRSSFGDLSVYHIKNDCKRKTLEERELPTLFKLHQFCQPKRPVSNAPKWKYPTKYNEEAENRLIQVHLDFENCKKDMNLVNKKKELFSANETMYLNCKEKSTQNSNVTRETISAETITLSKPDSSEMSNSSLKEQPMFGDNCQHYQQQIDSGSKQKLQGEQGISNDREDKGVCHQQHEFCNYLGLTGMSTATAMANAVAELSQSNLTRRSLRVLRQQQKCQQKTIYTNDHQQVHALKEKQSNQIKKTAIDHKDPQQLSEHTLNEHLSKTSKLESKSLQLNLTTTSSNRSSYATVTSSVPLKRQASIQLDHGEPRIKIMYQISASNKQEAMIKSKKCLEDIKQPLRETIEEHFHEQLSKIRDNHLLNGESEKSVNGKKSCRKRQSLLPIHKNADNDNHHNDDEDSSEYIPLEKEYLKKIEEHEMPTTSKNSMHMERKCPWYTKTNAIDKNAKIPFKVQLASIPERSSHIEATIFSLPKREDPSSSTHLNANNRIKSCKSNIIYKDLSELSSKDSKEELNEINLFEQYRKALEASRKGQPAISIQEKYGNYSDIFDNNFTETKKSIEINTKKTEIDTTRSEINTKKSDINKENPEIESPALSADKTSELTKTRIRKQTQMLVPEEMNLIQTRAKKSKTNEDDNFLSSRRSQTLLRKTKSFPVSFKKQESLPFSNSVTKKASSTKVSKYGAKGKLSKSQCIVIRKKKTNYLKNITLKRLGKRLKGGQCKNIFADNGKSDDKKISINISAVLRPSSCFFPENGELLAKNDQHSKIGKASSSINQFVQTDDDLKNGNQKVYVNAETETRDFDKYSKEQANLCSSQSHSSKDVNSEEELMVKKSAMEGQRITRSIKQQFNNRSSSDKAITSTSTNTLKVVSFNICNEKKSPRKILETEKQNNDDIKNVGKKSEITGAYSLESKKGKSNLHLTSSKDIPCTMYNHCESKTKSKQASVHFVDESHCSGKRHENLTKPTPTTTTTATTATMTMVSTSTDGDDTAATDTAEDNLEEMPSSLTIASIYDSLSPGGEELLANNPKNLLSIDLGKHVNREKIVILPAQHKIESRTSTQSIGVNTLSLEELLHESPSVETRSTASQSEPDNVHCLHWSRNNRFQSMPNPLKTEYGKVLHIYYELDILIVIQEYLVSFWKCSRFCNILVSQSNYQNNLKVNNNGAIGSSMTGHALNCFDNTTDSTNKGTKPTYVWLALGEIRHLNFDEEIEAPYANRICVHNSMPIYVEMRGRQLPSYQRESSLISMYVNIYYYNEELMAAKSTSIHMDTIQSALNKVNYTTITDSLYFIMTWQEENGLSKVRSGLCKYSLTPQLDTLASIREFKSIRHIVRYLECMPDGKLIGFGDRQITVWDHHCGDVLMNYDLGIDLGTNVGTVIYPNELSSATMTPGSMMLLFQYRWRINVDPVIPELLVIACNISATSPTYRILHNYKLSPTEFNGLSASINTDEYVIIKGQNVDKEVWISCTNPGLITCIPSKDTTRFYGRRSNQVIEMSDSFLRIESVTNMVMKLAAGLN